MQVLIIIISFFFINGSSIYAQEITDSSTIDSTTGTNIPYQDTATDHLLLNIATQETHATSSHRSLDKKQKNNHEKIHENNNFQPKHEEEPEIPPHDITLTSPCYTQHLSLNQLADGRYEVPLSTSLPLRGELSLIGSQILDGLTLFFNKARQEDLSGKYVITLSSLNDHGSGPITKTNTQQFLSRSPLFTSYFGANSMHAVAKLVRAQKLTMFFPIDGTSEYRNTRYPNVIFFRPPINKELDALIDYADRKFKRKIAVFYEASTWGEAGFEHVKTKLNEHDRLSLVAQGTYQPHTVNIAAAVKRIVKSDPDAIICIAQSRPAYNFIRQAINHGLHKTMFLGLSELISLQETLRKSRGITVITSSVTPNPIKSDLQIVKEYRADMKKYYPNKPIMPFSLEGYINAMIFYAALTYTRAPLSPQNIITTIHAFKNFNFKGLRLNYDPESRSLSHQVWINTGAKKWLLPEQLS